MIWKYYQTETLLKLEREESTFQVRFKTNQGGQKQRVNLARCYYKNTSIILMDDPLSAVDAHVGEELFSHLITRSLKGKTRVLVTHQLHVLPRVDYVVVMDQGTITEQGTYKDLIAANGEFSRLVANYGGVSSSEPNLKVETAEESDQLDDAAASKRINLQMEKNDAKPAKELMTAEERNVGSVKGAIWFAYLRASGGLFMGGLVLLGLILSQGSKLGNDVWLTIWTSKTIPGFSDVQYIGFFWAFGFGQIASTFALGIIFTFASVNAARNLHAAAAARILRTPISFFGL